MFVTFYVLPSYFDRTTILGAFDRPDDARIERDALRARGVPAVIRVAGSWPKGETAPRFL